MPFGHLTGMLMSLCNIYIECAVYTGCMIAFNQLYEAYKFLYILV
jgi:hypothetical protein